MKKLSKTEKTMLTSFNMDTYNKYRCEEHGIYMKKKNNDDARCFYCKKSHAVLTSQEISELLKN